MYLRGVFGLSFVSGDLHPLSDEENRLLESNSLGKIRLARSAKADAQISRTKDPVVES